MPRPGRNKTHRAEFIGFGQNQNCIRLKDYTDTSPFNHLGDVRLPYIALRFSVTRQVLMEYDSKGLPFQIVGLL